MPRRCLDQRDRVSMDQARPAQECPELFADRLRADLARRKKRSRQDLQRLPQLVGMGLRRLSLSGVAELRGCGEAQEGGKGRSVITNRTCPPIRSASWR